MLLAQADAGDLVLVCQSGTYDNTASPVAFYSNRFVGGFVADLLVESRALLQLRAARTLYDADSVQCINHLKAARLKVRRLVNFNRSRADVKRSALEY
jgi:GxxExxY protein